MIDLHLKKLRQRDAISGEEERAIRGAVGETRRVAADCVIIRRGQELTSSTLLLSGILCRARDLKGGRRQITELHIAGDFADLHSFTLKRLDHNIISLTPCTLADVPHDNLRRITERFPHLTRVYWFATNLDAAIHREWATSLGRRPAIARLGHLFCELYVRLQIIGLAEDYRYELPLTQPDLAECLGLTPVHVNRTLQELRKRGLIDFADKRVTIHDWAALTKVAEFSPDYLYLERKPR